MHGRCEGFFPLVACRDKMYLLNTWLLAAEPQYPVYPASRLLILNWTFTATDTFLIHWQFVGEAEDG